MEKGDGNVKLVTLVDRKRAHIPILYIKYSF